MMRLKSRNRYLLGDPVFLAHFFEIMYIIAQLQLVMHVKCTDLKSNIAADL